MLGLYASVANVDKSSLHQKSPLEHAQEHLPWCGDSKGTEAYRLFTVRKLTLFNVDTWMTGSSMQYESRVDKLSEAEKDAQRLSRGHSRRIASTPFTRVANVQTSFSFPRVAPTRPNNVA